MRLRRLGSKKAPFYHVVVAEARTKTSNFIEKIGYYNPRLKTETRDKKMVLDMDRVAYWKKNGAHPTDVVEKFIRMKDPSIYGAPIEYRKRNGAGANPTDAVEKYGAGANPTDAVEKYGAPIEDRTRK